MVDPTKTWTTEHTSRAQLGAGSIFLSAAGGPPRLVVLTGTEPGRRYALVSDEVVIGRGDGCDVQIDDTKVSRKHARVMRIDGEWSLEDLGSRNGTMLNGKLVETPTPLSVGDRIQLSGETLLLFARHDPLEDLLLHRQQMEVIGQLAAGIAHDFNNLLNVISASVAFIATLDPETTLSQPDVQDCHADIRTATQRAAELTAKLLTIARRKARSDEGGRGSAVDVTELCSAVLQLVRRTFDQSIAIEHHIADELAVDADHGALHQLLMNLCLNARDAMPEGGTLTLRAWMEVPPPADEDAPYSPSPQVVLEVADNGVGMNAKTRERVFEPFFTTKAEGAGSGLGLATVFEVATNHGGMVEVDSTLGVGSTFRVRLPARTSGGAKGMAQTKRSAPTWDGRLQRTVGRVLIVDDQELVRRSLGRLLRADGHEVEFAADGHEALAAYASARTRPDVVLMDLDMPNLSGGDTLERLRELDPHARIVLISGYYDEARKQCLLEMGAMDFLAKPVDAHQLRDSIRIALGTPARDL